jgi:hypothetical protein
VIKNSNFTLNCVLRSLPEAKSYGWKAFGEGGIDKTMLILKMNYLVYGEIVDDH